MKIYRRIPVLLLAILAPVMAMTIILVPLAKATPSTDQNLFDNNSVTSCEVPSSYTTIQAAVDEPTCQVINVAPGLFMENVVIGRDVIIQGAGIEATIVDGSANGVVFDVQEGLVVTLIGMTIRNGRSLAEPYAEGGGIYVRASSLTVIESLLIANTADMGAGIYGHSSIISVQQSQVISNSAAYYGGGIGGFFGSVTTIDRSMITSNTSGMFGGGFSGQYATALASTIADNSAQYGGGFYSMGGHITITQSILSGNVATQNGGGIFTSGFSMNWSSVVIDGSQIVGNSGGFGGGIQGGGFSSVKISSSVISNNSALYGGGIGVSGGALTVRNSTLSSNMANEGGGIRNSDGAVTLSYSTLSGNSASDGGSIYNQGVMTATTSIIAGDGSTSCSGSIISQGYNIANDSSCNLTGPGDMNSTDPQLGPLQDNGGPTLTHMPLPGSLAIDAGDPLNCPLTDQRGAPRPYDGNGDGLAVCDIGSVEYLSPVPEDYYTYLPLVAKP